MRKLTNFLVILFVVTVLVSGVAMGYLWYSTKQQVDQIVAAAKPFAQIDYGSVTVSLDGYVSVNQLRITPNFVNDTISVGAIRLNTPNLLALLMLRWQFNQGQLPDALSLSYQDIELPLQGGILNPPLSTVERSPLDSLEAVGCGPVSRFGGAEWREMSYEHLISNAEIGYRFDATHHRLELRIGSNTRDSIALNMNIDFITPSAPTKLADLSMLSPKLAQLNIAIRDDGFNQRRNRYCAEKSGKLVNEYLADHVQLVVERLRASGIYLGPGLIAAYQGYLVEGSELNIAANPPVPINLIDLSRYAPADAIKLLGPALKVNKTTITDFTVNWDTARVAKAFSAAEMEPTPVEAPPAPVVPEKPVVIQKTFHSTPINDLRQYTGKIVKLRMKNGVEYAGQLSTVEDDMLNITIRKSGGSVTLSLRINEIASAEVLY